MIGQVPGRVVVLGLVGFVITLGALGAYSIDRVSSPGWYVLALLLALVSVVAVLAPWPARGPRRDLVALAVVVVVVAIGLIVVPQLLPGRPSYALWFPGFVWVPLSGLALRGHPRLALLGALASAATTMAWAWGEPAVGLSDGVYRVVTPTAMVVVAVGIERLVRQYGEEVRRAHAEQLEAARLSAGARAAEEERRTRLSQIEQIAAPVLVRLRDSDHVDERLATECRLLEAALRDGIRGRHLVDPAVRETLWAARTRGVEVTLLDDSGTDVGGDPPPVAAAVRRCTVALVERLETGAVTVRLSCPDEATLVVLAPDAADLARTCRAGAHHEEPDATLEVEHDPGVPEEMVVTVRRGTPPTTAPRGVPAATAPGPV